MASKIPYDTSADALLHPARNAVFFAGWNPEIDHRNQDLLCAEMSRLAYAGSAEVARALETVGFSLVGFIGGDEAALRDEFKGTQGFVASHATLELTVLAFRGTESNRFDDLISDLKTLQSDFRDGARVHAGFVRAYGAPVQSMIQTLLAARQKQLLVTGHSLGGALATLAALDTAPDALITFGSPRVGDESFKQLFSGMTVRRYVNACDLVPRVPPKRFDRKHLAELMSEITSIDVPASVNKFLEGTESFFQKVFPVGPQAALQKLVDENQFTHVCPPCYIRADGAVDSTLNSLEIREDKKRARGAYQQTAQTGFSQLMELMRSLGSRLGTLNSSTVTQIPRELIHALFDMVRGDPVLLRDLADHAPINYLSAFTGRKG